MHSFYVYLVFDLLISYTNKLYVDIGDWIRDQARALCTTVQCICRGNGGNQVIRYKNRISCWSQHACVWRLTGYVVIVSSCHFIINPELTQERWCRRDAFCRSWSKAAMKAFFSTRFLPVVCDLEVRGHTLTWPELINRLFRWKLGNFDESGKSWRQSEAVVAMRAEKKHVYQIVSCLCQEWIMDELVILILLTVGVGCGGAVGLLQAGHSSETLSLMGRRKPTATECEMYSHNITSVWMEQYQLESGDRWWGGVEGKRRRSCSRSLLKIH